MKLSVVIPMYNEEQTICGVLDRLERLEIDMQIIVVDDGSTDRSAESARREGVTVLQHAENKGKGAALHTGFQRCSGDVIVVQDADLEYDPDDLLVMLKVLKSEERPIVFGSRNLGHRLGIHKGRGTWPYYLGGKVVGWACNLLFGTNMSDAPTCYKMFRRHVLDDIVLKAQGFGFCPEFCARVAKQGIPIHEVPIHYAPRSKEAGKKLRPRDGIDALLILVAIRFGLW